MTTTVLIADDDQLVRSGLRVIIDSEPDLSVVGLAATGAEAIGLARSLRPDVVLMDVRMPELDGIQATRRLLANPGPPKVLVVTTFENDGYVYDALRAGAAGFLLKRASPAEMLQAIRTVAGGDSLLYPAAIRALAHRHAAQAEAGRLRALLTAREGEILRLVAEGLSNAEIAGRLYLGVETVKTHVGAILAKLGARDRTQAVIAAYESGFITPGGPR
ncbi:MAG TPA: response regulator transcription factor [Streptosporangiaceae bacterium]|nr:response regulator transcription factor [Streptosporangiaceae bacterium]